MLSRSWTARLHRLSVLLPLLARVAAAQDTTRVSVDSSGAEGNGTSAMVNLSADGQTVVFMSNASNLVANDGNGMSDVFVHDRSTGLTERVSVDSSGAEADKGSTRPGISADGQIVCFASFATNLIASDTNWSYDIFVHDRSTGVTDRVSVDSAGGEADSGSLFSAISANGQFVAFVSPAGNLVAGDTNNGWDVFVHDRSNGITERVSVDSSGMEGDSSSGEQSGVAISADGRLVAFASVASNLVAGDTNGASDVFVHDRSTGITERVSVRSDGRQAGFGCDLGAISADGEHVVFMSIAANLSPHDTNGCNDVYVHDLTSGVTVRVSVDSSGAQGNDDSGHAFGVSVSSDGQTVAFQSDASNLVGGDANGTTDVFVHDRTTGSTVRVSVDSSGAEGDLYSVGPSLSADGNVVAFDSVATNLVNGDSNSASDDFVHERCSAPASWSNYGAGFPGTNGIPAFTSRQNPVIGTTIDLDLANSLGSPTIGLLFFGFQQASLHTNRGGDLLVVPALVLPITFSYGGNTFTGNLPLDWSLCGIPLEAQAIEADPGAAKGVSFTSGLELVLGR